MAQSSSHLSSLESTRPSYTRSYCQCLMRQAHPGLCLGLINVMHARCSLPLHLHSCCMPLTCRNFRTDLLGNCHEPKTEHGLGRLLVYH